MIIGIDGNEANIENRVGVNTYAFELLWNIWKLQDEWKGSHKLIVYLKDAPRKDMPAETQNFKYRVIKGGSAWILTKLMPHLLFAGPPGTGTGRSQRAQACLSSGGRVRPRR